ncbi:acetolactate synthase small subunit [Desulfotomaculum copahuensis]|uniref:Acetolactate synthase small subunit n=1 Tax=Desulfotomaculum copahuensis TaxID=1838280 RepID=A0A1B7LBR3_9FIRM|nr:acetolactate synthase small subunit [Desulfotomaculum copahuensis]OAT79966.1 acetolactate synthase small subunit [Desulfotomaculum copahuensis]
MKHTLAVLVTNKPGVLARISGLLSRRVFNIESIAAGYTEEPDVTRITIVVKGDDQVLDQVVKQLSKLIDVIKIQELQGGESIARELALIKVKADPARRSDIVDIVEIFRANIVDINRETMVIELTGDEEKIDALCAVLEDHGIVEMVRTGKISLSRGPGAAKYTDEQVNNAG